MGARADGRVGDPAVPVLQAPRLAVGPTLDAFQLGPVTLAADRLVAIVAAWLYVSAAEIAARRTGLPLARAAWIALAAGLVAARGAYVAAHWPAFAAEPWWTPLQFWQGGLDAPVGFTVAAFAGALAAWLGARRHERSVPRDRARAAAALALAVLALPATLWFAADRFWLGAPPARTLPDVAVAWLDGRPARWADFAGKPLVVNVWATWCGPCRREMPMLARAARERTDATFVFLNTGEHPATIRRYLVQSRLSLPVVLQDPDGSAGRALGAIGLPTTYFVAADGRLVRVHVGEIGRAAVEAGLRAAAEPPR